MFGKEISHNFQVYNTSELITVKQYRQLLVIPNVYIPYIIDFPELNNQVYIYTFDKERTLHFIKDAGVNVEPMKVRARNSAGDEILKEVFVGEYEAKKFIDRVKLSRELKTGDIVTVKQFHNLPFKITGKTKGNLLILKHELNNISLAIEVQEDRCQKVDYPTIEYIQRPIYNPIAKIYIDCDMYDSEQKLLDDMLVIKTIYKDYKLYIMNPIAKQLELAVILGLSTVSGNKYSITRNSMYNHDIDYIYSSDLNFLRYTDKMMYLEFYDNIGMPEIINTKNLDVLPNSIMTDNQLIKGNVLRFTIRDTKMSDLKYEDIRKFFKDRKLDRFVEDIPYFVRALKR